MTRELAARLIAEERALLERFEQLLEREAAALRSDDVATIEAAGADRQACTSALLRIDEERRQACRMLGFGDGRDAFERLLAGCDPGGELARSRQASRDLMLRCKAANDRNGAVVTAKLRRVEALLVTLRGGDAGAPVYGASGESRAAARSVALGLA
ncbi:MAG TPA: flagellar protein FlgN [Steroidobacteraceae bacterium]|nr:flagellar protein FlgN [Steroidobacteraceae bacterium]